MLISKIEKNKKLKRERIEEAAFELFANHQLSDTSIDDIVKKASVAKGTFYLYFKDKEQLLHNVICKRSTEIIKEALQKSIEQQIESHVDQMLYLTNYVIDYLSENKESLKLIRKNLSWSLLGETLRNERDPEMDALFQLFLNDMQQVGYSEREAFQLLFMIIELISTVSYSSIIMNQPDNMEQVKPMLLQTIRKMLQP